MGSEYGISKYTWLVFGDIIMENIYDDIYIPYNCELFVVKNDTDDYYTLEEIYHVKVAKPNYSRSLFAIWTENEHLKIFELDLYKRRMNLNGTNFKVTSYSVSTFRWSISLKFCKAYLLQERYDSMAAEIIKDDYGFNDIARLMNFKYENITARKNII